jgi:hypothetical protein
MITSSPDRRAAALVILVAGIFLSACGAGDPADDTLAQDTSSVPLSGGAAVPPENRFDPTTIRPGTEFLGLTVTSANVSRSVTDESYIGDVRFAGDIELVGRYHPHFDYPENQAKCFSVAETSVPKLPRWPDDERRVWFCFENQEFAIRELGAAGTSGDATIVVRRYMTVRSMSDVVDEAELVSVVRRGTAPAGG